MATKPKLTFPRTADALRAVAESLDRGGRPPIQTAQLLRRAADILTDPVAWAEMRR